MADKIKLEIRSDEDADGGERELFRSVGEGSGRGSRRRVPRADGRRSRDAEATPKNGVVEAASEAAYERLIETDRRVFDYLEELCRSSRSDRCVCSYKRIHESCGVSFRTAQNSADRLTEAGLIERAGYDLGNLDKEKRGTTFILRFRPAKRRQNGAGGKV